MVTEYRGPQHRKVEEEQYFTDPVIAEKFVSQIDSLYDISSYDIVLEPSAGSGNFLKYLPEETRIGLDIEPQTDEVIQSDFFDWEPDNWNPLFGDTPKIITIGNPPFGRNSDLALRFFHHASQYSDVICFIIPITWVKYSIHKKLPSDFGLYYSEVLDPFGFIYPDGSRIKNEIRCVAQCWSRFNVGMNQRIYQKPKQHHHDFEVIKDDRDFDIWMAWWGSFHKEIFLPKETDASSCFRKIKFHTPEAEKVFRSIEWKKETEYLNVGVWALSEDTLVEKYEKMLISLDNSCQLR